MLVLLVANWIWLEIGKNGFTRFKSPRGGIVGSRVVVVVVYAMPTPGFCINRKIHLRNFFFTVTMPLRNLSDLEKTVAAASGVFRDVYSEEPPYHTAEELWEGLKQGDEGARLLFVFFLRVRKK